MSIRCDVCDSEVGFTYLGGNTCIACDWKCALKYEEGQGFPDDFTNESQDRERDRNPWNFVK